MAVLAKQFDDQPVGAGLHGKMKSFTDNLAAATPLVINFGKYKLLDAANVVIQFGVGDNGPGDTFVGAPDTTIAVAADGKSITLTDAGGGPVSMSIIGDWEYNRPV